MPNWVHQQLHVVGPKAEVDRFVKTGLIRHGSGEIDDVLEFERLCPLKRRDKKGTYSHRSGVVLNRFRTRTQATFAMITSWDYPDKFYARLAEHWRRLSFVCSVNEDMNNFGGVVQVLNGETMNLVRDYGGDYSRRSHARQIRRLLDRWGSF